MIKKLLPVLLALALLFTAGVLYAQAEEPENVFTEYNEAIDYLRERLVARETAVSFAYTGDRQISLQDVLEYEGSAPYEGDYLRWSLRSCRIMKIEGNVLTFSIRYYSSFEQERSVNAAVEEIISEIRQKSGVQELSDYNKAVLIYDWLCEHITYDDSSYDNEQSYSAYGALVSGVTRCQGYALAFYRLAREMGLDSRIIAGEICSDSSYFDHAWNAFRYGESWYYADPTLGAQAINDSDAKAKYAFFMLPDDEFGAIYKTKYTEYSASLLQTSAEIASYPFNMPIMGVCENGGGWTLDATTGALTLTEAANEQAQNNHWSEFSETIVSVSSEADAPVCTACMKRIGLPLHCDPGTQSAVAAASAGIPCHTPIFKNEAPATCKQTGRTSGTACDECRVYLSGCKTLPSTEDHVNDGTGKCETCGISIDCEAHGFCGEDIRWFLSESGELVLTGTGETYAYAQNAHPYWWPYRLQIKSIQLQNGITRIGDRLFYYLAEAEEVRFPESLIEIGEGAFAYSESLISVSLPPNLEYLGLEAFLFSGIRSTNIPMAVQVRGSDDYHNPYLMGPFSYSSLETISFEDGIKTIPGLICNNANHLTDILFPSSVTDIGPRSFAGCDALKEIPLSDGLKTIGDCAFQGCDLLTSVIVPSTVTSIGWRAFDGCDALNELSLPNGLKKLGSEAFRSCKSLSSVYIPSSVTEMNSAFAHSSVRRIEFGNGIRMIPDDACNYMDELAEAIMPDSVTTLGAGAFARCPGLSHIKLSSNLKEILLMAFENDTALSYVFIPARVSDIDNQVFKGCSGLTDVCFASGTMTIADDSFDACASSLTFHCTSSYSSPARYAKSHGIPYHTDLDQNSSIYATLCTGERVSGYFAYCKECNKIITSQGIVDKNGHIVVTDVAVEATCVKEGRTEGAHCSVCGTVFIPQETIPAQGHRDILSDNETPDGVCDVCGTWLWGEKPKEEEKPEGKSWVTSIHDGLAKFFSNIIKLFRRMFGK